MKHQSKKSENQPVRRPNLNHVIPGSLLLLALSSCSKQEETVVPKSIELQKTGKLLVETDYPYYYISYHLGWQKEEVTGTISRQSQWEHDFQVHAGDSMRFEVHTIQSNVQGSHLNAHIEINGKPVKGQLLTNPCENGNCPLSKPLDIRLDYVAN